MSESTDNHGGAQKTEDSYYSLLKVQKWEKELIKGLEERKKVLEEEQSDPEFGFAYSKKNSSEMERVEKAIKDAREKEKRIQEKIEREPNNLKQDTNNKHQNEKGENSIGEGESEQKPKQTFPSFSASAVGSAIKNFSGKIYKRIAESANWTKRDTNADPQHEDRKEDALQSNSENEPIKEKDSIWKTVNTKIQQISSMASVSAGATKKFIENMSGQTAEIQDKKGQGANAYFTEGSDNAQQSTHIDAEQISTPQRDAEEIDRMHSNRTSKSSQPVLGPRPPIPSRTSSLSSEDRVANHALDESLPPSIRKLSEEMLAVMGGDSAQRKGEKQKSDDEGLQPLTAATEKNSTVQSASQNRFYDDLAEYIEGIEKSSVSVNPPSDQQKEKKDVKQTQHSSLGSPSALKIQIQGAYQRRHSLAFGDNSIKAFHEAQSLPRESLSGEKAEVTRKGSTSRRI